MQLPPAATVWRVLASTGLGVVAGTLGTVMHRAVRPWGLLVCLLLVLVVVLTARAWVGWSGYLAGVVGTLVAVQVLAGSGPGGDVLVPGSDLWGWGWAIGVVLALGAVALVPRRWVEDDAPSTS
ncbi:hypothetical protein [Cellulomonas phragmiteti]|uniref:Histidinol dehydrogenase n=1 Tax=Cellulomonas phragmiteti TaxID=478780 RepID=A0ABQ4DM10_9CELL|nr:hypothetical protein [Cellulomonas phragmiteti]GIG40398.1 hypothetical protein Cph01nite_21600 [Cellulomonas phragmiteti]